MLAEWTWVIAQMAPWRFTSSLTLTTSREGKREKIKKESNKQEMTNIYPGFAYPWRQIMRELALFLFFLTPEMNFS